MTEFRARILPLSLCDILVKQGTRIFDTVFIAYAGTAEEGDRNTPTAQS